MAYSVIKSSQLRTLLLFRTLDHIRKYVCKHSSFSKYYFVSIFHLILRFSFVTKITTVHVSYVFNILTLLINCALRFCKKQNKNKKTQTICDLCVEKNIKCTVCYKVTYIRYNRTYMAWWHTRCFPCIMFKPNLTSCTFVTSFISITVI